jgi:hypothetical protein
MTDKQQDLATEQTARMEKVVDGVTLAGNAAMWRLNDILTEKNAALVKEAHSLRTDLAEELRENFALKEERDRLRSAFQNIAAQDPHAIEKDGIVSGNTYEVAVAKAALEGR